jgi:hypothetical protein
MQEEQLKILLEDEKIKKNNVPLSDEEAQQITNEHEIKC